jgi:DNA (cytosine-5)-methyltransferase 1
MVKKLTYISLFSGAGGLDIGFKEVGFESLCASDIMDESEKTFKKNWPDEPFIKTDIRTLSAKEILKITKNKKPDVIIGGPPCQGFSLMGAKNSSDPRNTLFESYVRLVKNLEPKCFVFENVKGLKTMFQGRYLEKVVNSFSEIGYDVNIKLLNSANYGVPQKRERLIIVGTKLNREFYFPKPNSKKMGKIKNFINVNDAIMDLEKNKNKIANHLILNHNEVVIKRYKLISEGGKLPSPDKLPKEIRRKNFGNTYVRLDRNQLAPTMVPGNNAFPIHPTLHRSLTPREAARIQTFPDNIIFEGSRRIQCILVGNAVPPLLGANLAIAIKDHIENKSFVGLEPEIRLKRFDKLQTNKKERKHINELTFIDLFSGAGGITIGLMNAGFKPLLAADFDKWVAATHKHNFPEIPFIEGDLSNKIIKKEIISKLKNKKVDLVIGGPPCQGFSIFGKRRFVNTKEYNPHIDPRNKLVYTFLDYVKTIKPNWFIMENVVGLANMDNGLFLKKLLKEFKSIGYEDVDWKIINTADYGVPQKRRRCIIIGNRTNHIIPWPKPTFYEEPKDWQKSYRNVGEVIDDLIPNESHNKYFNHNPMKHAFEISERMKYIEEGKKMDLSKLPKNLQYGKNTGKLIKNFSHVYKRLNRKTPSSTLVPGHSAFPIHPFLNRQITVREAARIQTFPDNIEFLGSQTEQCRQVGNAFPCLAAEHIGNFIKKAINNNWKKNNLGTITKKSIN